MNIVLDQIKAHERKPSHATSPPITYSQSRLSSLIPSLLGGFIPLLSLPALTESWSLINGEKVRDPTWNIVIGCISFISTIFINFTLICRLLCAHPRILSIASMIILLFHIVLVVVSTIIFDSLLPMGAKLSTAFYLSITSGVISTVTLLSLIIDGHISEKWKKENGAGVTTSQRSLIIFFTLFISVVLLGTISYRYLIPDLTYVDAAYFVIQSMLTTGFGDIVPLSTISRVFSLFYLTLGIISFALLVAFLRSTILESLESQWRENETRVLKRFKTIQHPTILSFWKRLFGWEDRSEREDTRETAVESGITQHELDYENMILEFHQERCRERRSQMAVALSLFVFIWLIGAMSYTQLESLTFFEAFYFCFISFSSVGYGDYSPKTAGGRAFFIFWAILGAASITVWFSVVADAYSTRFKKTFRRSFLSSTIHSFLPKDYVCECEDEQSSSTQEILNSPALPQVDDDSVEKATKNTLFDLIDDITLHLDDLMNSKFENSNFSKTVEAVMNEGNFSITSRELVASEPDLKRFIYLRRLKEKLQKLKVTEETVNSSRFGLETARDGEKQVRDDMQEQIRDDVE